MANKYLDAAGLAKLWELIDAKIDSITVEAADIEALTNEEIEEICTDAEEEGESN